MCVLLQESNFLCVVLGVCTFLIRLCFNIHPYRIFLFIHTVYVLRVIFYDCFMFFHIIFILLSYITQILSFMHCIHNSS